MSDVIRARVLHKRDTLVAWQNANPVLLNGELVFVVLGPGNTKIKVGDGASNFNALPYATDLSELFDVRAAVPTTDPGPPQGNVIWEASEPGTYTNFFDEFAAPIVLGAGEYMRMIDEGTHWTKVLVPFSTPTDEQMDAIYDLYYPSKPTTQPNENIITKWPGGLAYTTAVPTAGDWYVDMKQSFDLAQLFGAVLIEPRVSGEWKLKIVQIDEFEVMTDISAVYEVACTASVPSIQSLFVDAQNFSDPASRTSPNMRCYIALANKTGSPLGTAANVGSYLFQYSASTGGKVATIANTDLNIQISIFTATTLQSQIRMDVGQRNTYKTPGAVTLYMAKITDDILLINAALSTTASVILPSFGITKGKTFTVKNIGSGTVDVSTAAVFSIDGASVVSLAAFASVTVVYDGAITFFKV